MRDEKRFKTIMALVEKQVRHVVELYEIRRQEVGIIPAFEELAQVVDLNEALLASQAATDGQPQLGEVICNACWGLSAVVLDFERCNHSLERLPDGTFKYVMGLDPAYILTTEEEEFIRTGRV